tara:strand:+ start:111 stop:887 length:777 start_codon:yes stop_codon:yes gene_type:complete
MNQNIWVKKRKNLNINECYFYHTTQLPNHGLIKGEWDLRGNEKKYLGEVDVNGKRVLEIGTASGCLCFFMEQNGAEVVAYDLSDKDDWDIVPYSKMDNAKIISERKQKILKLNNSFWITHEALRSKAKAIYGTVYNIPKEIGMFDICTMGSILLHLRDPFLALQKASSFTKKTIIITDIVSKYKGKILLGVEAIPSMKMMRFIPNASKMEPFETWWEMSPKLISEFLKILGFNQIKTSYHYQTYLNKKVKLYTIVANR